jgi:hypothetical protein
MKDENVPCLNAKHEENKLGFVQSSSVQRNKVEHSEINLGVLH